MKTYTINGTPFSYDDTLHYYDFFLQNNQRFLVEIRWDQVLQELQSGQTQIERLSEELILLDRWSRDAPRKRHYRKWLKEGVIVLSGEYWFDDYSDEEAERIFVGFENSAKVARRLIETFLPALTEQCNQTPHPAQRYYVENFPGAYQGGHGEGSGGS